MENEIFFSFIGFLKSKHSKLYTIGRHLDFLLGNVQAYYSEISSIVAASIKSKNFYFWKKIDFKFKMSGLNWLSYCVYFR